MHLITLLRRHPNQAVLETLTSEIAAAARHRVRRRVDVRSAGMSLNVLRGYVRARAVRPVREQAETRLHGTPKLSGAVRTSLIRKATERVTHLVVRDLAGLETAPALGKAA